MDLGIEGRSAIVTGGSRGIGFETAKPRFGAVDILVSNAGQMYSGRFAVMTEPGLKEQL